VVVLVVLKREEILFTVDNELNEISRAEMKKIGAK
jgi:hypothetical protein